MSEGSGNSIAGNWVGLRKLALIIGRSYPTTLTMVKKGYIDAVRVGGQWRVPEQEVWRFLKHGNHPNPTPKVPQNEP
jgi:excisionase family DNA binding protein